MPRVLITAGPTHEPVDDVRYLANRSSGRMGIALADAAAARDWPVTLLLGPVERLPEHPAISIRRFVTTPDLKALLEELWPLHDLLIMAAAVADYRPRRATVAKLSRDEGPLTLELEPTEDLLAAMSAHTRPDQKRVGFALEPAAALMESARQKLSRKQLDAIVANPLETMDADTATAHLLLKDGRTIDAPADLAKREFAAWLVHHIESHVLHVDHGD